MMKRNVITYTVLALLILTGPALAERLAAGQAIPAFDGVTDQNGEAQDFATLKGENGLVLVFVRSADWCPYCQVQLLDLDRVREEFEEKGYNLVSLSYDSPEKLAKFKTKYRTDFTMLSDPESKAIKAFGLLNEEYEPDHFAYGVPHPAIYVIGPDKRVEGVFAGEGYKVRPNFKDVLSAFEN